MSGPGILKLKKPIGSIDKKKKKQLTETVRELSAASSMAPASAASAASASPAVTDSRTKAEKAFDEAQQKREQEIIEKKIAKTHRQKIEDFNAYLAKMPEHVCVSFCAGATAAPFFLGVFVVVVVKVVFLPLHLMPVT